MNRYIALNLLTVLIFALSFVGAGNWAIASVLMIAVNVVTTAVGTFFYSKIWIQNPIHRMLFALGVLALGCGVFVVGAYLNERLYDGLVTIGALVVIAAFNLLLYFLGKKNPA